MASKNFTPPKNSKKATIDIAALEAELRRLYQYNDKERLKKVKSDLDYLYYVIR